MSENSETIEVRGEKMQVGAKLLALNDEGKYLLIRKNPDLYPEMANKWDIPGGRWLPNQEFVPDTLNREVGKETGLNIIGKPEFIAKQKFKHSRIKDLSIVRLTYKGHVEGQLTLDEEHFESRWVTLEEMKVIDNLEPYVKELIDQDLIK